MNYAVFRAGFDAPKTRAIFVARPVYSPNLYFQLIGRGLRGEKNGGNDRCLILNVEDNIENFEGKLAGSDLDWLWAYAALGCFGAVELPHLLRPPIIIGCKDGGGGLGNLQGHDQFKRGTTYSPLRPT